MFAWQEKAKVALPGQRHWRCCMSKQKGFSLIELLIVVTVIMVISAIAVPNFMRSRLAANEAS